MADYNILDSGARGDGQNNDAAAIQSAIEACTRSYRIERVTADRRRRTRIKKMLTIVDQLTG